MNKGAIALAVGALMAGTVEGVAIRVHIPGIVGQDSTPGYPGAMAVQTLTIQPGTFTLAKQVDAASPGLFLATAQGTQLFGSNVLLYNDPPAGAPAASLGIASLLVSSYQVNGLSEEVVLSAGTPASMYLVVPGIVGEDGTPGYPSAMRIDSFSLTGSDFTVVKGVDSATPQVLLAVANGTHFPSASVLFYNAAVPGAEPDAIFVFGDVLGTSHQVTGGGASPGVETAGFSFGAVAPEPSAVGLAAAGAAGLCGRSRRRRGAPVRS
jgi:type VI protein secretion system component Hcp